MPIPALIADVETSLRQAVEVIPQGLAVFDADFHMVTCNGRYRDLLDLPDRLVQVGAPLYDIALYLARRGDLGVGDATLLAVRRVESLTQNPASVSQRMGRRGQVLEFHSARLDDGGLVVSFADVTARVDAEAELEKINNALEGRVEERTAALTRVNSELECACQGRRRQSRQDPLSRRRQPRPAATAQRGASLYRDADRAGGRYALADLAHAIEASLNAVEEIMSALLDISRLDGGSLKPSPSAFAVRDLQKKLEVEFAPMARERNVELHFIPTSRAVFADRALVARIAQNLVSNAVKYTRPGGRVVIGCRLRGQRIRFDIIDTGIGFNRDQHALIFAEFSRLELGARMAQGLGLGLSIVKRLVTALGLTLELDSTEGRGSRFSLYLPMTRLQRATPDSELGPPEPISNLSGLRVLCVDNERAILDAMEGLLSGWGVKVRSARSLKDIDRDQLLVGWLPDMVLMDYHLDQTSGLDAIEWLRHNVGGHLPAALVTADRSPAVRTLAEERGIAVVTKPVKPAALRATISGLAGQRRRQTGSRPGESNASN